MSSSSSNNTSLTAGVTAGPILGIAFIVAVMSWWFCRGRVQAWWLRRHPEDAPNVYPHNILRPPPVQAQQQFNNVPTAVPVGAGGGGGYGSQPGKPYGQGGFGGAPNVPVAQPQWQQGGYNPNVPMASLA